jgi:hypothetical protein
MRKISIALIATSALLLSACEPNSEPNPAKATQAQKAAEAANSIQFSENAEIDNIKRRLELTSNPGQIGFVLLYTSVKGKITSGGKRLTSPQEVRCLEVAESVGCSQQMVDAPSDEGTYGSSNPYIFFWTVDGQYIQWSGKYLYSDKPFRIEDPTIVILSK